MTTFFQKAFGIVPALLLSAFLVGCQSTKVETKVADTKVPEATNAVVAAPMPLAIMHGPLLQAPSETGITDFVGHEPQVRFVGGVSGRSIEGVAHQHAGPPRTGGSGCHASQRDADWPGAGNALHLPGGFQGDCRFQVLQGGVRRDGPQRGTSFHDFEHTQAGVLVCGVERSA